MPAAAKIKVDSGLLRRLHSLLQQTADLRNQIDRGPRQVAAAAALVAKAQSTLDQSNEKVRQATMVADEKQLQMRSREDKVRGLESQLNTAASNKEFSLLKEQIAAEKQANDCLGDEIFEVLEDIDKLNEAVTAAEADVKENADAKAEREQQVESRLEVVREDLRDAESQLAEEETKLPAAVMPLYRRLVNAAGEEALASLDGTSCSHCNQVMRTQLVDDMQMGNLMQCPSCHAILYQSA